VNSLRSRTFAAFLVAAVAAAGCERGNQRGAGTGEGADDGCDMVRTQAHPDPAELVREYVRRDGEGQFLEPDDWFTSALACPARVRRHNDATLVAGYAVMPRSQGADTARIGVTYQRLGDLDRGGSGSRFLSRKGMEVDTFVVVRTAAGWRIAAPLLNQHVLPKTALAKFRLSREDSQAIRPARRR
jgi:hypothetical protein